MKDQSSKKITLKLSESERSILKAFLNEWPYFKTTLNESAEELDHASRLIASSIKNGDRSPLLPTLKEDLQNWEAVFLSVASELNLGFDLLIKKIGDSIE